MRLNPVSQILLVGVVLFCAQTSATDNKIPRTASGRPHLSGTYDIATLTPMPRPEQFGDNLYMTPEPAENITKMMADRVAAEGVAKTAQQRDGVAPEATMARLERGFDSAISQVSNFSALI